MYNVTQEDIRIELQRYRSVIHMKFAICDHKETYPCCLGFLWLCFCIMVVQSKVYGVKDESPNMMILIHY